MNRKKYNRFCLDSNRWFPDISNTTLAKYNAAAGIQVPRVPVEFLADRVGGGHRYEVVQLLPGERVFAACPEPLGYRVWSSFMRIWDFLAVDRADEVHQLLQHWDKLLSDGRDAIWVKLVPEVADAYDQVFWIEGTDSYVSNDAGTIILGEWLFRFTNMQGLADAVDVMAHQVQHCLQVSSEMVGQHSRQDLEFWATENWDLLEGLAGSRRMWGLFADNADIEPNDRPRVESPMTEVWREAIAPVERFIEKARQASENAESGTDLV